MRLPVFKSGLITLVTVACMVASPATQETFSTPEELVHALVQAAESDNIPALLSLFGPEGRDVVRSGDPVQARNQLAEFDRRAREKTTLEQDPLDANRMFLSVGNDDWPFPVPIVRVNGRWELDTAQGKAEILARRIGANELAAIETCRGYVEAQYEYASVDRKGEGMLQYAQKIVSSPGLQDGLYWESSTGEPQGPVANAFAKASAQGYRLTQGKREPYHGYYFRILKGQGPNAPGGAFDYVVNGAMIGGFALVAWPAQYGVSGIKTFLVNHEGIVYEKDMGPNTNALAQAMTRFNPDKSWRQVE